MASFYKVDIKRDYPFSDYIVKPPAFTPEQQKLADGLIKVLRRKEDVKTFCNKFPQVKQKELHDLVDSLDVVFLSRQLPEKEKVELFKQLTDLLGGKNTEVVVEYVMDLVYGFSVVQSLFNDPDLEEVMVNGTSEPVFVYHREYGLCRTNLKFTPDSLQSFLDQIPADHKKLWEDVKMSDGSRANVIKPPLSTEPTVTVRMFRKQPFSVIDLINKGTMSSELAAYFWLAADGLMLHPFNMLIVGGTAAGKTSTLNSFTSFIPPSERIITIEDTAELNLFKRLNWVQLASGDQAGMSELVINALRMRPDRIIVGDIRGAEAESMFVAMNTGHRGVMGTLHANNDRDALKRLENAPMSVPKSLIPMAEIVVVQHRVQSRTKGLIRRITQVSEISKFEEGVIALNEVFKWNPVTDQVERTELSLGILEVLSRITHFKVNDLKQELEDRKQILEYLQQKNVCLQEEIDLFMQKYYSKLFLEPKLKKDEAKKRLSMDTVELSNEDVTALPKNLFK
ncbi:MAG: ATPase, T2SS/T4P/T4SS family [Candidatus Micrarchaeota archaeon]